MNIPIKKSCFYSAVIIILSQLSISLFTRNFQLSVAVIFLSAMTFLIQDFPLIPVTVLSAVGVCSLRMLLAWIVTDTTAPISRYFPEMTFYLCYGFLLYIYVKNITSWKSSGKSFFRKLTQRKDVDTTAFSESPNRNHTLLVLTVIDYVANFLELLVRLDISAFHIRLQTGIFLTAFFRSCVVWLILTLFEKYRMLLLKKEHEERYQRLVLLISKLNGEMVWMQKNTLLIEETMNSFLQIISGADGGRCSGRIIYFRSGNCKRYPRNQERIPSDHAWNFRSTERGSRTGRHVSGRDFHTA